MKTFFAIDVIEQRFFRTVSEIDATDGDSDHIRARSGVGAAHFLEAAVFSGTYDKTGLEGTTCDDQ
jgi:hypothetical protein